MSRARRKTAKTAKTTADYAMPAERLDRWLRERAASAAVLRPTARSLSMLDGFVAAIVVGPVSIAPLDWICPLLGVEPEAFNHDTEEFAAIAAAAMRFNVIGKGLVEAPDRYEPLFLRGAEGDVDARPWCMGFYAAMELRLLSWSKLLQTGSVDHGLLLPILFHCVDDAGQPMIGPLRAGAHTRAFTREAWRDIAPAIIAMREFWQPIRFNNSQ